MIDSDGEKIADLGAAGAQPPAEELPYRVELWDEASGKALRVLARASSLVLARAILAAARIEHPDQPVRLARGERLLDQSN